MDRGTTARRRSVALLCSDMDDGSSSRIAAVLRDRIAAASPGARLPSTRALVAQHRVSPVTVQKALRDQRPGRRQSGAGWGRRDLIAQYRRDARTATVVHVEAE